MTNDQFKCPSCGKPIVEENENSVNGMVIKSRLVFLNENGEVLCKCMQCKTVVALPLNFVKSSGTISN